jgi:hypothetical protein
MATGAAVGETVLVVSSSSLAAVGVELCGGAAVGAFIVVPCCWTIGVLVGGLL